MHFIPAPMGTRGLFDSRDGIIVRPVAFIGIDKDAESDAAISLEGGVHHYAVNGERARALFADKDKDMVLDGVDWFHLSEWLVMMDETLANPA